MSYTTGEVYAALHGPVGALRRACGALESWIEAAELPEEDREALECAWEELQFTLYGPGPEEAEDYEDPDGLWDRPEDDVGTVELELEAWDAALDALEGVVNACPEVAVAAVAQLEYSVAGVSLHSFYSPEGGGTLLKPGQKDWFGEAWAVGFFDDWSEPPEDLDALDLGFPPEEDWIPFEAADFFEE